MADKTRLRYVLYRAEPDTVLLSLVLRLIPRHPEHSDAFFTYLGRFDYRRSIERVCIDLVQQSPYQYVRGEAWHVLARYRPDDRSLVSRVPRTLTTKAVGIARLRTQENFLERWGACHFLCVSETVTGRRHSYLLKHQSALVQSLLSPVLPDAAFGERSAATAFLLRSVPEPGLSVCSALHARGVSLAALGIAEGSLRSQVANTLRELGVLSAPGPQVDPIAEILDARYGVPRGKSWHLLLGGEYVHALGLLKQAEAAFDGGRSFWLTCQNSFNQTVFLALQRHLSAVGHVAACTTINRKGELVDYGVTLDASGPFSTNCSVTAACFRDMNTRRNRVPVAHPYDKKTATQTQHVKAPVSYTHLTLPTSDLV